MTTQILNNQQGIVAVIVAVCLVMLLGFLALSIDTSHLVVARNELQNAADAGALAGAAELYTDDGQSINTNANQIGFDAAVANFSEQSAVEVNWTGGNVGDVQRGHWSFGKGSLPFGFTPNDSTEPVALWGVSTEELDGNPDFINAVRVRTRRKNIPIASWFARIFGHDSFEGFAEAVAYIGFAGSLKSKSATAPIALCLESIITDCVDPEDPYTCEWNCSKGRFISDADDKDNEETGMWTNMTQVPTEECKGGADAQDIKPLIDCEAMANGTGVNEDDLVFEDSLEVINGQVDSIFNPFETCWKGWEEDPGYVTLTLPVISCKEDPTTCAPFWGAVTVQVIHVTDQPNYKDLPPYGKSVPGYSTWTETDVIAECGPTPTDECIWSNFADHFGLVDQDGNPAPYFAKSIYFLQDCKPHPPMGITGGPNYGILAEIPVLVR